MEKKKRKGTSPPQKLKNLLKNVKHTTSIQNYSCHYPINSRNPNSIAYVSVHHIYAVLDPCMWIEYSSV